MYDGQIYFLKLLTGRYDIFCNFSLANMIFSEITAWQV